MLLLTVASFYFTSFYPTSYQYGVLYSLYHIISYYIIEAYLGPISYQTPLTDAHW